MMLVCFQSLALGSPRPRHALSFIWFECQRDRPPDSGSSITRPNEVQLWSYCSRSMRTLLQCLPYEFLENIRLSFRLVCYTEMKNFNYFMQPVRASRSRFLMVCVTYPNSYGRLFSRIPTFFILVCFPRNSLHCIAKISITSCIGGLIAASHRDPQCLGLFFPRN